MRRMLAAVLAWLVEGKNREVTEAHVKKFNESQSKYRIEGTKTAPTAFHVVGEALPNLWQASRSGTSSAPSPSPL